MSAPAWLQLLALVASIAVGTRLLGPVAMVLVRSLARRRIALVGNFWVDLVRGTVRIFLPLAFLVALVLVSQGVIQNLHGFRDVSTVSGATQSIPGGPVASQEAIKELGQNGGGFFNAIPGPRAWT